MVTICIWVMSLVERVISEAVGNLSNSAPEKFSTLRKTSRRRSRPVPAATLAER